MSWRLTSQYVADKEIPASAALAIIFCNQPRRVITIHNAMQCRKWHVQVQATLQFFSAPVKLAFEDNHFNGHS